MIRHIPEGVFPFDDCGYSRNPLSPFEGQTITLDCLCDSGIPILEFCGIHEKAPIASSLGELRWRFVIPAFQRATSFQYRFVCDKEKSPWYTLDVLKKRNYSSPLQTGSGWIQLDENIFLNYTFAEKSFSTTLNNYPAEVSSYSPFSWRLVSGCNDIWSLSCDNNERVICQEISVGLRADNSIAWQEMIIKGSQKHIWATGERFDSVDQQGKGTCGKVVEHFTQQGQWSYLPTPFFITDAGFGFYRNTGCDVKMDFGEKIRIASLHLPDKKDTWLIGTPSEQLSLYMSLTGMPELPPEWTFGLWISANGWCCDADVEEQLDAIKKYNYPASVMVLEAWSDESTFYRWSDAWKNPQQMINKVRDAGLHLVLWQIPVIKAIKDSPDREAVVRDRALAISKGWVVKYTDGSPYVIPERWFEGSLLPDFTNDEACDWWFSKRDHLLLSGVEGFKTDGGEFLFGSDISLSDGTHGWEAHNAYPMHYIEAYNNWMKRKGIRGVTFSRAGYAGAQTVPIHWAGDQLSTWRELRAQLTAGISAGLSGIIFWSFDIGGFAGELPESELYLRATAFACFCPVMQWHAEPRNGQFYATHDKAFNNDRSPWNLAEKLNDTEIINIAGKFARIREELRPYLWEEAQHCVNHSRPMMAHLCLDYPDDSNALKCDDEYMLGRKYLVAPITEKGSPGRNVYFPKGRWKHYFSDEIIEGKVERYFDCPITEALVFEKLEE